MQNLVKDVLGKIHSCFEDQILWKSTLDDLKVICKEMFVASVEEHSKRLISDLESLIDVSLANLYCEVIQ